MKKQLNIDLAEHLEFVDLFLKKLAIKLPNYLTINKNNIDFKKDNQLAYKLIYCLRFIELETFKIFIKINLANSFIKPFKSFVGVLISFLKISDYILSLSVNYQSFDNLTINN